MRAMGETAIAAPRRALRAPVRIGVVGAGRIGRVHAGFLDGRVRGAVLAGVHDVRSAEARALAGEHGVPVYDGLEEMFSDPQVHAVAICSSTDTHADLAVAAAQAGKAIFCEKPLSLDLADVDRVREAVTDAGVAFQIGFNRRFDPGHRSVRDAVARGSVRIEPSYRDAGDVDTALVVLEHEDGCVTAIDNSRRSTYGYDQRVEAFGSAGMAASGNPATHAGVVLTAEGESSPVMPSFFLDRYAESYERAWQAFVDAVREGREPPVGIEDARAPLVIGLAAWRSLRERRPVRGGGIEPWRPR